MRKKKFTISLILFLLVFSSINFADTNNKIGDKIADVLYTDIVTEINGREIQSFNINGSTAIYVTQAQKLGYNVNWDGDKRLVSIENNKDNKPVYENKKLEKTKNNKNKIGDKVADVLYTDIITKINGEKVESFNINGSTAIYVTALKKTDSNVKWKPDSRKVVISNTDTKNDNNVNNQDIDEKPEDAVARVEDEFINQETFNKMVAFVKDRYTQKYGEEIWEDPKILNMVKDQSLEQIIRTEIVKNHIQENFDFEIDQEKVEETFKNFKDQINANEEMSKFYKENEITDEFLKKQIANELYLKYFNDILTKEVKEEKDILDKKYEKEIIRVKASHILVKTIEKAKIVKEKLEEGIEFSKLSKEYSKDPGSAQEGGNLGYFGKGEMVDEFEEKAFELNIGDISEPVKSQFGFHIIKVHDKQTVNNLSKNQADKEVVEKYKNKIISQVVDLKYNRRINSIKDELIIERYIDFSK